MLDIQKTVENNAATVALEGRLDTVTAPELQKALEGTIPEVTELTLDFSALSYISSAGLRVLLAAQKQMNGKGSMKVTGVNETIMEIFEVTGFADVLTIR
jgi:anti-sigma B factor antagonist